MSLALADSSDRLWSKVIPVLTVDPFRMPAPQESVRLLYHDMLPMDGTSVLLEGVIDLFASLLEVAHALVALAFSFHLLIASCFAEVLLGSALGLVLLVLQLVVPAHRGAPFACSKSVTCCRGSDLSCHCWEISVQ